MTSLHAPLLPRTLPARIGFFLALGTLFLLPLFINPWAADSYVLTKWILLGVGGPLALLSLIAASVKGEPFRLALTQANGLIALFFFWMVLSVSWAASLDLAWWRVGQFAVVVSLILALQSVIGGHRARVLLMLGLVLGSTVILALWALLVDALGATGSLPFRVQATLGDWRDIVSTAGLGNTGHVADALVLGFLGWLAVFVACWGWRLRLTATLALVLHAAALIVCWSVHSNLSLVVASLVLLFLLRRDILPRFQRMGWRWPIALVLGWGAVLLFFVVDHPLNPHGSRFWAGPEDTPGGIVAQAFASPRWQAGFETREAIWLTSLEMVRTHPWLGVGAGNFTFVYPATVSQLLLHSERLAPYAGLWTNAAHNEILQTWAELGIVGVFLLAALILAVGYRVYVRLDRCGSTPIRILLATLFAALVAVVLQAQMNFPMQMPHALTMLFLLLVLPDMIPARSGEEEELLLPVQRPYGPFVLGVIMRNVEWPTELRAHWRFESRAGEIAALTMVAALALIPVARGAQLTLADIHYAEARRAAVTLGTNPAAIEARIRLHDRVLAVWPGHVDCRSGRTELLLMAGRFEEVPAQTELVLRRLNATEVFARRAVALERLGQSEAAEEDWAEVRRRLPSMEFGYRVRYLGR